MNKPLPNFLKLAPVILWGLTQLSLLAAPRPGEVDPSFVPAPEADFPIRKLAVQADGKILVAGGTNDVTGADIKALIRLNVNGSLDESFTTVTTLGGPILDVFAEPDGNVLVAGSFTNLNGHECFRAGRLNATGGFATSLLTNGSSRIGSAVTRTTDGSVWVGLRPGPVDEPFVSKMSDVATLVRILPDGSPPLVLDSFLRDIRALLPLPDGGVLVGGRTRSGFPAQVMSEVVKVRPDLEVEQSWDRLTLPTASVGPNPVAGLAASGDCTFYLAGAMNGRFPTPGVPVGGIGRFKCTGGIDPAFTSATAVYDPVENSVFISGYPDDLVLAVTADETGRAIIGGRFLGMKGVQRFRIARLNLDGSPDEAFGDGSGPDGEVTSLAMAKDGGILLAGDFRSVAGVPRVRLAKLVGGDPTPGRPEILSQPQSTIVSPGVTAALHAEVRGWPKSTLQWEQDGVPVIGATNETLVFSSTLPSTTGAYRLRATNSEGVTLSEVARLTVLGESDPAGQLDQSMIPELPVGCAVYDILEHGDGRLYVAGAGLDLDRSIAVVRLLSDGRRDPTFVPVRVGSTNESVGALVLDSQGRLVIGGGFSSINGRPATHLARLDASGMPDASFHPNLEHPVTGLRLEDNDHLLVADFYRNADFHALAHLFRLTSDGAVDPNFAPVANLPWGFYGGVGPQDTQGRILLAGSDPDGVRLTREGVIDARLGHTLGLLPEIDDSIWASGYFGSYLRFVRFQPSGKLELKAPWNLPGALFTGLTRFADGRILFQGFHDDYYLNDNAPWRLGMLDAEGNFQQTLPARFEKGAYFQATLPLADGRIAIRGLFNTVSGQPRNGLAILHGPSSGQLKGVRLQGEDLAVELQTSVNRTHRIQAATSLTGSPWTEVESFAGDGRVRSLKVSQNAGPFFRVVTE